VAETDDRRAVRLAPARARPASGTSDPDNDDNDEDRLLISWSDEHKDIISVTVSRLAESIELNCHVRCCAYAKFVRRAISI